MSIAQVVTFGFGSFGSVNKLPTMGFDIGQVTVPDAPGIGYTMPNNKLNYTMSDNKLDYRMDKS